MRDFDAIYAMAAKRKGGPAELEKLVQKPLSAKKLAAIPDDRWLSCMTKCIFQAGFNWKVVEAMWPGFEEAFESFSVARCAMLNDDDLARLAGDRRIVRYGAKIAAVRENAAFLQTLAKEKGSAAKAFSSWPRDDYVGLLALLKKQGSRLGGNTGQNFLRFMGVDSFILSRDVVARLIAEGVVDKEPTSQRQMQAVQQAFDTWAAQSGRSFTEISRVLAMSTD